MKAMVLHSPAPITENPLQLEDLAIPRPGDGELIIRVDVCGVCRTDLHVVEGDLPPAHDSIIPGHEVVGRVTEVGPGCRKFAKGDRVGVAWLYESCEHCAYCLRGDENLCDAPRFTGYTANGGYAEYVRAREDFVYSLPDAVAPDEAAPLLCAGIIGYRALIRSGIRPGEPLGLYGFGGSAHIVLQIARHWGCDVYVCTRGGEHQALAREMGACWTGPADAAPPVKLRGAILFAPVGDLALPALEALDKGGTLAIAGIHLTDIPAMNYQRYLFRERNLCSVTANTREDGRALLRLAAEIPLRSHTQSYPLEAANQALRDLKEDRVRGAAVLQIA